MSIIGFLSPKGEFTECKELEHAEIAKILCEKYNIKTVNHERDLAKYGFCFFQKNYAGIPAENKAPMLTNEQIDWIIQNYDTINRQQRYFISEKLKHDETYKQRNLPEGIANVSFSGLL